MRSLLILLLLASCGSVTPSRTDPPLALAPLAAAAKAELRQEWEIAAWHLDVWARRQEPDASWRERRLRAAVGAGQTQVAADLRVQHLARNPRDVPMRLALADDWIALDRPDEALACLQQGSKDPRLAEVAAVLLLQMGRQAEAAAAFELLAVQFEGIQRGALFEEAAAAWRLAGDRSAALRCLELALEGVQLSPEEERLRQRLRALESGIPRDVADAVALLRGGDAPRRLAGIRYLARGSFADDVLVFLESLEDSESRVVAIALRQLGIRAPGEIQDFVAEFLDHPDPAVRDAAVEAAGRTANLALVPMLLARLNPQDRTAFRRLRSALTRLTGRMQGLEMDPNLEERGALMRGWRLWWATQGGGDTAPSS